MTHKKYAEELNNFSYNSKDIDPNTLIITDETMLRVRINRLYYALYHRIMEELPDLQVSTGGEKHKQIEERLARHASNEHTNRVYQHFRDLKTLRVWADYEVDREPPTHDLTILFRKTYAFIKAKRIF